MPYEFCGCSPELNTESESIALARPAPAVPGAGKARRIWSGPHRGAGLRRALPGLVQRVDEGQHGEHRKDAAADRVHEPLAACHLAEQRAGRDRGQREEREGARGAEEDGHGGLRGGLPDHRYLRPVTPLRHEDAHEGLREDHPPPAAEPRPRGLARLALRVVGRRLPVLALPGAGVVLVGGDEVAVVLRLLPPGDEGVLARLGGVAILPIQDREHREERGRHEVHQLGRDDGGEHPPDRDGHGRVQNQRRDGASEHEHLRVSQRQKQPDKPRLVEHFRNSHHGERSAEHVHALPEVELNIH
eukprot:CAMPEP_0179280846 /NCGR_PEP_ID=MMETSP0797-20121207/36840_1 /TAXON_ID=47934 /ORGANISM="Dinophysis acuminata, Strain DAEP01" /LENGTH=301 /DNA_ID=CAMNT_0020989519 /DNA_START=114 /DNA_END=1020 /DNA_ORIENTATION=+